MLTTYAKKTSSYKKPFLVFDLTPMDKSPRKRKVNLWIFLAGTFSVIISMKIWDGKSWRYDMKYRRQMKASVRNKQTYPNIKIKNLKKHYKLGYANLPFRGKKPGPEPMALRCSRWATLRHPHRPFHQKERVQEILN